MEKDFILQVEVSTFKLDPKSGEVLDGEKIIFLSKEKIQQLANDRGILGTIVRPKLYGKPH